MEEVRPTRAELLERRSQILLAQQGMDLLKQKRDALLIEFMAVMDETLRLSDSLQKTVSEAQYSLAVAKSVDGNVALRSVGIGDQGRGRRGHDRYEDHGRLGPGGHQGREPGQVVVHARATRSPASARESMRPPTSSSASSTSSSSTPTSRRASSVWARRSRRRTAASTRSSRSRCPGLQEQVAYISQTLDERAREDLFRLKKVKKKIEKKKAAAS